MIGILGVLLITGFVAYRPLLMRAEAGRCMATMRSLHVSFSDYIRDQGRWPQVPEEVWDAEDDAVLEDWWIETMKPYGVAERDWQCPTIKRTVQNASEEGRPKVHYAPTPFDDKPFTPYRWGTQPWFVEIGNAHGRGAHILFPDGSIKVMDDFVPEAEK